jgi:hypothetical protein
MLQAGYLPTDSSKSNKKPLIERIETFARKDNIIAKLVRSVWVFNA